MMLDNRSKGRLDGAKPTNKEGSPPAKRRAVRRCLFVASAEVTELSSETRRISGRTSELGVGGCYIKTLDPFPEGTLVQLRIFREQGVFETKAKVVYSLSAQLNSGMGLAFKEMAPHQRSLLEDWLAEIVTKLRLHRSH
jgi:hypothetical protein